MNSESGCLPEMCLGDFAAKLELFQRYFMLSWLLKILFCFLKKLGMEGKGEGSNVSIVSEGGGHSGLSTP